MIRKSLATYPFFLMIGVSLILGQGAGAGALDSITDQDKKNLILKGELVSFEDDMGTAWPQVTSYQLLNVELPKALSEGDNPATREEAAAAVFFDFEKQTEYIAGMKEVRILDGRD